MKGKQEEEEEDALRKVRQFSKGAAVVDSPWPGWWSDPWTWTPAWTGTAKDSCAAGPVCPGGKRPVPPAQWPYRSVAETAWQRCSMLSDTGMSSNAAGHGEIPTGSSGWAEVSDRVEINRCWVQSRLVPLDPQVVSAVLNLRSTFLCWRVTQRWRVPEFLLRAVTAPSHPENTGAAFRCCWKHLNCDRSALGALRSSERAAVVEVVKFTT